MADDAFFRVGERLRVQLRKVQCLHEQDLAQGDGSVQRLGALRRNYRNAAKQCYLQWVFPQQQRGRKEQTGEQGRYQLDPSLARKAIRRAVIEAKIRKAATSHSCRYVQRLRHAGLRPGNATTDSSVAMTSARCSNGSATTPSEPP